MCLFYYITIFNFNNTYWTWTISFFICCLKIYSCKILHMCKINANLGQTKIKVAFIVGMLCFIFKLRIIPFLRRLPYHYWDTSFWRYVWYPPYPLSCRLIVLFPFPLFAHSFFCKIRWIVRKIITHEIFFIVWNELTQVWAIFASEFLIDIQWRSLILIKKWRS